MTQKIQDLLDKNLLPLNERCTIQDGNYYVNKTPFPLTMDAKELKNALIERKKHIPDFKALSHAVRVGRQAIELAETGNITFPLTYADHLLRIKKGELDFAEVSTEIENLLGEIEIAFEKSDLPDEPNREWIDNFLISVYKMQVG